MSTQPNRIPTRERLLSVREAPVSQKYAARFLDLHPKTVLRKAREGSLPAHPVGTDRKRWHFYLSELDHWPIMVLIQRSAVGKRLNKLKTEYSQDEVPIERGFILELRKWQALCLDSEGHWLFPSPVTGRPYHADSIRADYLAPTGLELGLGRIGFHTFRHTYRAWLDETGAPVGVQQKLMRHAHVSTTMDQYGNASALAKRKANRPIVQRLLRRSATQQISIQ